MGCVFLHDVGIFIDSKHTGYYILKHKGKHNETSEILNSQIYYETNIRDCTQKLMAIPIILIGKYGPHSNMLIIRKKTKKNPIRNMGAYLNKTIIKKEENETTWEIEHFEPHGRQYSEERDVNKAIDEVVHDILKHDPEYNKDNVKITHPNQLCKLTTRTNETLQQILGYTKYRGSCSVFSMWYSFNRLLYPEKESAQIYEEMNKTLLNSKNPSETIENIILSFVSLINIDIDTFKVGNDKFLKVGNQKEITEKSNQIVIRIQDKINRLLTEQTPVEVMKIQGKINELLTQQKSIELNIILGEINRLLTHQSPVESMISQDKINELLTEQKTTKLKQIHDEIKKLLTPDTFGRGLKKTRKKKNEKRKKQKKEKTKKGKNKKRKKQKIIIKETNNII